MNMALEQAKLAYDEGEVPVGCVLVSEDGEILSMGRNRVHSKMDCTCHAEIECLRSAMAAAHNWRLLGSVIYCTLEPCLMCLGAIQLARVAKLKYGADDVRMGAVHSWISVPSVKHPFHEVKISGGLLATESSNLLRQFFRERRKEARTE